MVPTLVNVYNCTRSTATGFSPYYLMYGQKPWLPVNLYFGTQKADMNATKSTKFVQHVHERLKWAYKMAQHVIRKENQRYKWAYDHRIRCTQFRVGDKLLLKRTTFKGKHKIKDCWINAIYCVDGKPYARLPVFKITPVAGEGKVKVVHRNLLFPFGGNIEGCPENEGNWQDASEPQDCILAVSGDGVTETEVVLTDIKPVGDGDAICVQCVKTKGKLNMGWVKSIWAPIMWNCCIENCQWVFSGLCFTLKC